MIGPTEIILLVLIVEVIFFVAWSFRYVIRKSQALKLLDPNALPVWQAIVIHIFICFVVDTILFFALPDSIGALFGWVGYIILPIYLKYEVILFLKSPVAGAKRDKGDEKALSSEERALETTKSQKPNKNLCPECYGKGLSEHDGVTGICHTCVGTGQAPALLGQPQGPKEAPAQPLEPPESAPQAKPLSTKAKFYLTVFFVLYAVFTYISFTKQPATEFRSGIEPSGAWVYANVDVSIKSRIAAAIGPGLLWAVVGTVLVWLASYVYIIFRNYWEELNKK